MSLISPTRSLDLSISPSLSHPLPLSFGIALPSHSFSPCLLFQVSTLAASQSNTSMMSGGGALPEDVKRAEEYLKRRMGMRMTANAKQISDEATAQVIHFFVFFSMCSYT